MQERHYRKNQMEFVVCFCPLNFVTAAWVSCLLSYKIILIPCFSSKTVYYVSTWPKGFDEWRREKELFFLHKISFSVYIGTSRQKEDVPNEVKQKPSFQASSSMSVLNYFVISKG